MSMVDRKMLYAPLFLLLVGVMAGLLNSAVFASSPMIRVLHWLAQTEVVHIIAHLVIFGLLAVMVGWALPRRHRWGAILTAGLLGTLLIEVTQIVTSNQPFSELLIIASVYDLGVNLVGVTFGLVVLRYIKT